MNHKEEIRNFIKKNLISYGQEAAFTDSDNIFKKGFVSSLFAMKLLNFTESKFGIVVENEDMDIKNFNSINNIVALVERKKKIN